MTDCSRPQLYLARGHTPNATVVAACPDSRNLAADISDRGVEFVPVGSPGVGSPVYGTIHAVRRAAYSPLGDVIAAIYEDGTVRLWDAKTGVLRQTLTGTYEEINSIAFSPDGKVLAIGSSASGPACSWPCDSAGELVDLHTQQRRCLFSTTQGWPRNLAFCPRRRLLAASWYSNIIDETWVVDWHTGVDVYRVSGNMAAFSSDGKLLATALGDRGTVQLYHAGSGEPLATLVPPYEGDGMASICFSPDSRSLLVGYGWGGPALWDLGSREHLWLAGVGDRSTCGESIETAYSPDGTRLALVGAYDDEVWVWSMPDRTELATLEGRVAEWYSVDISPDGRHIATAGSDGSITIWDPEKLELSVTLALLPADPEVPSQEWITYTSDGYYASSPGADRFIRWEHFGELLPAAAFSVHFHNPDRVAAKLRGGS